MLKSSDPKFRYGSVKSHTTLRSFFFSWVTVSIIILCFRILGFGTLLRARRAACADVARAITRVIFIGGKGFTRYQFIIRSLVHTPDDRCADQRHKKVSGEKQKLGKPISSVCTVHERTLGLNKSR